MNKPKKILIATPTFPPEIGGSALYASVLSEEFTQMGYQVSVKKYGMLSKLPIVIKHVAYALKVLPALVTTDMIIVLDSFLVAVPVVCMGRVLGKKVVVRIGGDFLWEQYVERTHEQVVLSEFYTKKRNFSLKEEIIFTLTRYCIQRASRVVFSTAWQRDMFSIVYGVPLENTQVIGNVYVGGNQRNIVPKHKVILSPSRDIFLKNKSTLEKAFARVQSRFMDAILDTTPSDPHLLRARIMDAYCVVVPSLSEVSPNIVLESLSLGVPVVVTQDCGLRDILGDVVVWVDPTSDASIADGIEKLMDASVYHDYMAQISKWSYTQTPRHVAEEFLGIFNV